MNLRPTEYPLYLYVEVVKKRNKIHFEGSLCDGRKPTKDEMDVFAKQGVPYVESYHFFHTVHNPQEQSIFFSSLEILIDEAKKLYSKAGCTNGLILGYDGKNPPADKVIIYGEGKYDSESDFIAQARVNNRWSKYLEK